MDVLDREFLPLGESVGQHCHISFFEAVLKTSLAGKKSVAVEDVITRLLGPRGLGICFTLIFFIASSAANAAYLTVSEIFPLEIRPLPSPSSTRWEP
jgi:hypothetical protein